MSTSRTDILISIKPEHMARIVSRVKDHEFRGYLIPPTVERMWFYVSSPQQSLAYVARVSGPKKPGELSTDGQGNAEFNAMNTGEKAGYAYEVLRLWEIKRPLGLERMRRECGAGAPRRWVWLKRAVREAVGEEGEWERLF
ncbi:hypothetical protein CALCODRAFT_429682 [Calocera cornea HHB12733]|uniref:Uncharacterized protein n=1 Tax=Calocera cornea HHB12733 TaxID=1353952 RepID=A0A165IB04_9BASI|nr:hypothetical protein CALCODRAFT_429682 [Calocera cornea HHB12733]